MRELKSRLSRDTRFELMRLGGIVDENIYENDFVRVWFDDELMTLARNGNLWTLTYKGEITTSSEDKIPLAARFLLNYTVKYNVVDQ
ncbi:MAG: hypothetical protein HXK34_00600 [Atopobium sp.]|nr:hypothetical protein [Atopobium sp.]